MADRTVRTVLTASVAGFTGPMAQAAASAKATGAAIENSVKKGSAEWSRVGGTMLKAGALLAGGLGLSAKAAMDWESQFAGVRKTVAGTPEELSKLEVSLRGMARTMAASHEEIAAVAEAAGQLGVATPAIAGFTKVMIMLGETTNLTSDEAATSLAQMMNVMQTAPERVGNLASTLVALGNAGASTEREIMGMAQRIAGVGRQIGLSEDEVLGFASALANVGIEVEAGGSAISLVFTKLEQASRKGGTQLQTLSKVAGTDFQKAFSEDAAHATQLFIEGLGKIREQGGDVTGILKSLSITGIRESDAVRRLASSGKNLADSLSLAKTSIQSQSAIMNEYAARAATTESQVKIAWNNIVDSAITAGATILPMISQLSAGVAGFAQTLGSMPQGAQQFATVGVAIAAGLLLVGGGAIKAITGLVALKTSLSTLGVSFEGAGAKMKGFAAKYAGATAGVMALVLAIQLLGQAQAAQAQSAEQVAGNIDVLAKKGTDLALVNKQITDSLRGDAASRNIKGIGDAFKTLGDASRRGTGWFTDMLDMTGFKTRTGVLKDQLHQMDSELANLVRGGNLEGAQEAFRKMSDEAVQQGESVEFASRFFQQYRSQLEQTASSLGVNNLSAEEYAQWMRGDIPGAIQAAVSAGGALVGNLNDQQKQLAGVSSAAGSAVVSLQKYATTVLTMSGSEIGFAQSLSDAKKAIKENGEALNINTAKGRANQTALNNSAAAATKYLQALKDAGAGDETIASKAKKMREQLAGVAEDMGMSKEKAREFAAALIAIPGEVAPSFSAPGATVSKQQAKDLAKAVKDIPSTAEVKILAPGARPSKKEVDNFMRTVEGVPKEKKATLRTIAELGGIDAAKSALAEIKDKPVKVTTEADTKGARDAQDAVNKVRGKTVTVKVDYVGGKNGAMRGLAYGGLVHAGLTPSVGFGPMQRLAGGGSVAGYSPSPRADNIPIWGTAGEFMQPVDSVGYYGLNVMEALRRRLIPKDVFSSIGLADGGAVNPSVVSRSRQPTVITQQSQEAPVFHVIVTNPFTGEQVRAHTVSVVQQENTLDRGFNQTMSRQQNGK